MAATTDKAAIYHKVALERLISADVPTACARPQGDLSVLGRAGRLDTTRRSSASTTAERQPARRPAADRLHRRSHPVASGRPVRSTTRALRPSGPAASAAQATAPTPALNPAVDPGGGAPAGWRRRVACACRGDRACRRTGSPAASCLASVPSFAKGKDRAVRVPRRQEDLLPAARPLPPSTSGHGKPFQPQHPLPGLQARPARQGAPPAAEARPAPRARSSTTATGNTSTPSLVRAGAAAATARRASASALSCSSG